MKVLLFFISLLAFGAPKYGINATPLSKKNDFIRKSPAPDYWMLSPYYVGQDNDSSCSAATLVTLLNGVRLSSELTQKDELVTQASLREKFSDEKYKFSVCGDSALALANGVAQLGVSVKRFSEVLKGALDKLKIKYHEVKVVEIDHKNLKQSQKQLESILNENEKSNRDVVVLNFTQGILTGDEEGMIGHIALVGAYDAKNKMVLILDPDRKWYEPYWSPLNAVFKAVSDSRSDPKPGYVYLKLK
ncbi:MAG: hypothetical protein IPM57_08910 [Oligoflexia bacterium]|nr:hypothetical protein [Oligoflexia bacterium]